MAGGGLMNFVTCLGATGSAGWRSRSKALSMRSVGFPGRTLRVRDGLFLRGDLFPQLLDLLLDAGPFCGSGPRQVALRVERAVP